MGIFIFLLAGMVLMVPVIAIVALVRTGDVRRLLEESDADHRAQLFDLRAETAQLRREVLQLKERMPQPAPAAPEPPPAKAEPVEPIVRMTVAAARASIVPQDQPIVAQPPAMPAPRAAMASITPPPAFAPAASVAAGPPRKTFRERLRSTLPFEELLGMNLFAKVGIVLLVLGFALLGRMALISMGPGQRVSLIYAVSGALLAGGIWLERKERYRLLGRAGIGGGWALLFFTTYAMHNVSAMAVLASNTLDCLLMLLVAISMVAHTLRYKSQVVTGLAFLLAFGTVALSQDSVYALFSGVILALGIVAIALRVKWYELEIFGIVASYANHFYWLYKLYPNGFAGHSFPQFWQSSIILALYWTVFRVSYMVRTIRGPRDETVSSLAGLINTVALLAVMKFQSTRPELAFYALLALGAAEFFCGQLPPCRRRRNAFKLLTVMGTILMFAAVPFKFSGNSIALFWMIVAELLLVTGIVQAEVVFRRLGLIAGTLTGALVLYEALSMISVRRHSGSPLVRDGILLLTVSLLFCINAQFIRRKWAGMFASVDAWLATAQGYLGAVAATFGVWALFTADWTALGWAALFLAAVAGKRWLDDNHLMVQAWALAGLVLLRCLEQNCHFAIRYPHHIAARLFTLTLVAAAFYAAGWLLAGVDDLRVHLGRLSLWAGSLLLAVLVWLDVSQAWVAPAWVTFALILALLGRRIRLPQLCYQEHALAATAVAQLIGFNLNAPQAVHRYVPLLCCGAALYAISRFCTAKTALYARFAAWMHTWAATALLAALAWHDSSQAWLAVVWALFAIALAAADRRFSVEELPYQAHVLALLAVARAVTLNLYLHGQWHGIDVRLVTVSVLVAALYALARWVRMPESLSAEARHAYTWTAAVLAAWMVWGEVKPVAVAVAWALFGLLLFELGVWKQQKQLRLQAYGLLIAAFARIFFVNLTAAAVPGERLSARVYTIVPMVLIYFYVWARLQPGKTEARRSGRSAANLVAYLGTGSVAALLYFEAAPEWVVVAWAVLALALVAADFILDRSVFLQQSILLVAAILGRSFSHNIFGGSYFTSHGWRGPISILCITAAVLLGALPLALRLGARYKDREVTAVDRSIGLKYPEQIFFFAPILLVAVMIGVKMDSGMVTLSWGIEGVAVILLGLLVKQRSYRLTGLFLLLLCVGKIVIRDAWQLGERDRYTTFIVLGAALTLVSTLYGKYRETVRKLL